MTGILVAFSNLSAATWTLRDTAQSSRRSQRLSALRPGPGLEAVIEHGVLSGFTGVLVHDSLSMYDSAKLTGDNGQAAFTHQLCGAHLCWELVAAAQAHPDEHWPIQAKDALYALNTVAHTARDNKQDHVPPKIHAEHMRLFRHAVAVGLAAHPRDHTKREQSKTRNLLERLRDRETDVLRFSLTVPFTNNQAESDLRVAETKVKVSGTMRTGRGLRRFARIRGYISSARKNGIEVWQALLGLFNGNPWHFGLIHAT